MEDEDIILALGAAWLISRAFRGDLAIQQNMREAGAKLYENLHPAETEHADHLPGHQLTRQAVRAIAKQAGFPESELDVMVAIALAESGGVPNAMGDGGVSIGLWQINTRAHPEYTVEDLRDPLKNARAALKIAHTPRGLKHWSVYRSGRYKQYLPAARGGA